MPRIELDIVDSVAHLHLSRPEALNALDQALLSEFEQAIEKVRESPASVLITKGRGRAFSAGSDLKELAGCSPDEAGRLETEHHRVFSQLDQLPQITVAAWCGHVLGGGLFLGIYHDFRVASQGAKIELPEIVHGWTPPWGISRLVELLGFQAARRLLLTDFRLDGGSAEQLGLVDASWTDDEFDEQTRQWVQQLAARPSAALTQTKQLLREMRWLDHEHWDQRAGKAFERCWDTPSAQEAVERFVERRDRSR